MKNNDLNTQHVEQHDTLEFYRYILNSVPAIAYINELGKPGDMDSLRNIWMNKRGLDVFNLTQAEITGKGSNFLEGVIHPDDLEIIPDSINITYNFVKETVMVFMYRIKKTGMNNYCWYYCQGKIIQTFDNGAPKQLLTIGLEITDTMHSQNQLTSALKEIGQLKYALKLSVLTGREKEVLHLIIKGKTDKTISEKLNISIKTAKKHRNNLINKTGVNNTAELVALAVEAGEI